MLTLVDRMCAKQIFCFFSLALYRGDSYEHFDTNESFGGQRMRDVIGKEVGGERNQMS